MPRSPNAFAVLVPLAAAVLAAGCGGGSSPTTAPTPRTGVFVDSPVENLAYRTATLSGRTDAQGTFEYLPGEKVTFSIGAIEAPPVAGGAVLSPMAVFGAVDLASDAGAVNFARLLQTVDENQTPGDGIVIPDAAHAAATADIDLSDDAGFYERLEYLGTTVHGAGATIVSKESAIAHLAATFPIVGAWSYSWAGVDWDDVLVLTFLADGTYVIAGGYGNPASQSGQPGLEMGRYAWNPTTGAWSADAGQPDTDGEWSFSHPGPNGARGTSRAIVTVDGTALHMFDPVTVETMSWTRVADAGSPLVGSWFAFSPDSPTRPVFLTLLQDGTYLHAEGLPADDAGTPGIELGTYGWDGTNALTLTSDPAHDTNRDWGFQDPASSDPEHVWIDLSSASEMLMDGDGLATTTHDRMTWRRIGVDEAAGVPE
jgi:hypothetical protein